MRDLFGEKPRRPRRVLMHVFDAGGDGADDVLARFECGKCGARTDWMKCDTVTEAKRGIPCEACNKPKDDS
ncbi:hypothetical protein [Burkholderia sp. Ac-20349]|uniref:hypothetical protein n=1 Tax=Burkholderia sp. Ac-20349 TaxID=2703893 RepID=UPI00197C4139|nr:hypothetical protein [Burkholderia sp. Ac-20349]MBN3839312.1 hypothetical protein [Burkholderia sp. Ac-20349]